MVLDVLPQLLINGLITGSIYAIIATAFALTYSVTKFIDFAHAAIVLVAAYTFFSFSAQYGIALSILIGIFTGAIVAVLLKNFVYLAFMNKKASKAVLFIVSIIVYFIAQTLVQLFFGTDTKTIKGMEIQPIDISGVFFSQIELGIIIAAIIFAIALFVILRYTKIGKEMRAVADNYELAEIAGINSKEVFLKTYFIAGLFASATGIILGLKDAIAPAMASTIMLRAITAAVIGGLGYLPGAIFGGYFLGITESIMGFYMPSGFKDLFTFTLLFVFLILRPHGIFGKKGRV